MAVIIIAVCWGVSAFFGYQALRTPWRPARSEGSDTEYLLKGSAKPWGRARFLLFSIGMALIGLYVLALAMGWRAG